MAIDYCLMTEDEKDVKIKQLLLERMKTEECKYIEKLKLTKLKIKNKTL